MPTPDSPSCIRIPAGIDLGTTNSVIALFDPTATALVTGRDEQGRLILPSVVAWDDDGGQLLAGREALALKGGSALPLSSIKRYMGLDRRFPVGPHSLTPADVSAVILHGLRDNLARTLTEHPCPPERLLDQAVITMPAYFNHDQIEATRQAGELAGFEVVELLHEPTAAAIYYSWIENHGDASYLVFDLGGGTFDVSIIRRRLGDYEVLAVSGDPFLGGDDFDRLLATHLIETGSWKTGDRRMPSNEVAYLFDPSSPAGAGPFARLVRIAEAIKTELSSTDRVERYVPRVIVDVDGRDISLEATVTRTAFYRLITDKIDRTLACCHDALGQARDRAGLRLGDIDHVILVGGSSRVPLVREIVQATFCCPDRSEHVRCPEPLFNEPDLCVAYGAALRAAGRGTRYGFWNLDFGFWIGQPTGSGPAGDLELHVTSPATTGEIAYQATGVVRSWPHQTDIALSSIQDRKSKIQNHEGASVRIRSLTTGLVEESFLDANGTFAQDVELEPEQDNTLEWTVCDADGRECARVLTVVRHESQGRPMGRGVLPTQLVVKPLSIEVLDHGRQRVKQVVARVGAALPGVFRCVCRTADQSGRVVVPIYEENRIVKQLVIELLDPSLPVGSPVEVEFAIDCTHSIQVSVLVRDANRRESATIEPAPSPPRPTRADVDEVRQGLELALDQLTGRQRTRLRARAEQVRLDLLEALSYDDEPRAIQRMAELRDLLHQAELIRSQALDPPWPRFAQLVRQCLDLASELVQRTGRDREELFQHVHAQDRYAEQANEEHDQALYRECWDNLVKYAGYLARLLEDSLPRPAPQPSHPPEEAAREEVAHFRGLLSTVWKRIRSAERTDLEPRLAELARSASGFTARLKTEPIAVLRDARRLCVEVEKIRARMERPASESESDDGGLLEGSS
jgi:molecular chaperone DnaK